MEGIENRVAKSSLVTLDLDEVLPRPVVEEFDMADYLFQGLVLKEKDFRSALKELDLEKFRGKVVAIFCSTDAILPVWAFMLVSTRLGDVALRTYVLGSSDAVIQYRLDFIKEMDLGEYENSKVVLKGCGGVEEKEKIYTAITSRLITVVQSLMYGEPCSTVPVFKKSRS